MGERRERQNDFESCSRGEPLGAARPQLKERLWSECWKTPRSGMEDGRESKRLPTPQDVHVLMDALRANSESPQEEASVFIIGCVTCATHRAGQERNSGLLSPPPLFCFDS